MRKKKFMIDQDLNDHLENVKNLLTNKENKQNFSTDHLIKNAVLHYEEFLKKSTNLKMKNKASKDSQKITPPNLSIPAPPKKKPIKLDVSKDELAELTKRETKDIKYILIECQICGSKPITMPVPKDKVLNSKLPVVDISYVHGDPVHVIVAQLDHDFQVRRRRASWVLFEKDFKK